MQAHCAVGWQWRVELVRRGPAPVLAPEVDEDLGDLLRCPDTLLALALCELRTNLTPSDVDEVAQNAARVEFEHVARKGTIGLKKSGHLFPPVMLVVTSGTDPDSSPVPGL